MNEPNYEVSTENLLGCIAREICDLTAEVKNIRHEAQKSRNDFSAIPETRDLEVVAEVYDPDFPDRNGRYRERIFAWIRSGDNLLPAVADFNRGMLVPADGYYFRHMHVFEGSGSYDDYMEAEDIHDMGLRCRINIMEPRDVK